MRATAVKNFHLPLPEEVYRSLREEAASANQPATAVARAAIEAWLRQRRRAALRVAIAGYAATHAGSATDLDPGLESASLELWRRPGRGRRR